MKALAIGICALTAATTCFALGEAAAPAADGPDLTGWIVDAHTGKPPRVLAVVHVAWTLRADPAAVRAGAEPTKRVVREIHSVAGGRFGLIDWMQHVDRKGWTLVPARDPVVHIYAPGYRRVVIENSVPGKGGKRVPVNARDAKEWKWVAEGAVQALQPLPEGPAALAAELAQWRRDIDADLAATPARDRDAAIRDREKLLLLFDRLCATLPAPPAKPCYAADSPIGRYVAERKDVRSKYLVVEEPGGQEKKYRIEAQSAPAPAGAQAPGPGDSAMGYARIPRSPK